MQTEVGVTPRIKSSAASYTSGAAVAPALEKIGKHSPPAHVDIELLPDISVAQRLFDMLVATIALIVFAPILLIVALIVRLDSPGPVLFRQQRVGRNRKLFTFVKFRTLYADARTRFPELYRYQYTPEELDKLHFKVTNDPRVTRAGRWLRSSTLDELPNFWNVLTGDMALVGPRPEIPEMLPYYDEASLVKYAVRPGITGVAQISGRGRLSFRDTVRMDIEYARNRSFGRDLIILVKTLHRIILRDGAF